MIRSAALALLLAAPLASAQTAADIWPLVPGNAWTYVLSSGSVGANGGGSSDVVGSVLWTVTDSVDTSAGRLPGVSVGSVLCAVRTSASGSVFSAELLALSGDAPCAVPAGEVPTTASGGAGFFLTDAFGPGTVVVGGEELLDRITRYGLDDGGGGPTRNVYWTTIDGIGVTSFSERFGQTGFAATSGAVLRQATINGQTIGQPLGTRTDFWPLQPGNRWEFSVTDRSGASVGAAVWTVVTAGTGVAVRLDHAQDGATVSTVTCPVSLTEASAGTGWQTRFDLGACALPEALLAPNTGGNALPLDIDVFLPGNSLPIGGVFTTADIAVGERVIESNSSGFGGRATSYTLARDIGPVRYVVSRAPVGGTPPVAWVGALAYARVGSTTYGAQIVAGEDAPVSTEALALSVGPNPVRASASLQFSLPAADEARIEILDALGRTVQRLDLGTRAAGAQSARLDVSSLAAGVYSVRLIAGDAQTAARISVVR